MSAGATVASQSCDKVSFQHRQLTVLANHDTDYTNLRVCVTRHCLRFRRGVREPPKMMAGAARPLPEVVIEGVRRARFL